MIQTTIKVAIANDTLIALEALRHIIATEPAYQLIWTARDGLEAIAKAKQISPDLLLMDLLMPKLDGVEATRSHVDGVDGIVRGACEVGRVLHRRQ